MYRMHNFLISSGHFPKEGPHPTWYRGPEGTHGSFPGGIFSYDGIDPNSWGPDYMRNYLGLAGNWLPEFPAYPSQGSGQPMPDSMAVSGSGTRYGDDDDEDDEEEVEVESEDEDEEEEDDDEEEERD